MGAFGPSSPGIMPDGTAALPGQHFYNDPDTGLYRLGANHLAVAMGGVPFLHNYQDPSADGYNIFLGLNAGNLTLSPGGGASSLASANVGIGQLALRSLTTGFANVAIGYQALLSATTGFSNVAVGWDALANMTTAYENNAFGYAALISLTTGRYNHAFGYQTFNGLTTGEANHGMGSDTGLSLTTGNGNIYLGFQAGYDYSVGHANSAITDDYGILIGHQAGRSVVSATKLENYITIGYRALADKSNQVKLGNTAITETLFYGSVGINTPVAPAAPYGLDISSGAISLLVGADANVSTRTNATAKYGTIGLPHYTNAEEPAAIMTGYSNVSDNVLCFGGGSGFLNAATYIQFFTAPNNTTVTGTPRIYIDPIGRVGIGIAPSGFVHIDQSDVSFGVPVLTLDQADVSEEFIRFIGTAANLDLTQSIVEEVAVSVATRAGFLKVYVQDDGNQIADQAYFVPIYTLA